VKSGIQRPTGPADAAGLWGAARSGARGGGRVFAACRRHRASGWAQEVRRIGHGVFPPNSKHRAWVTPGRRGKGRRGSATEGLDEPTSAERRAAMTRAQRLKGALAIDIETCPACGGAVASRIDWVCWRWSRCESWTNSNWAKYRTP